MKKLFIYGGYLQFPLKLSLKMKLTVLMTIAALFQIQANTYSQNKKISLDFSNASIETVIHEIEALSEFKFLLNRKDVDLNRKVSIKVEKQKIENILSKLFSYTDVTYEILNKQIVLRKSKANARPSPKLGAYEPSNEETQFQITGTVTDQDGIPLAGANVVEKGTVNGVTADFDGNFNIEVADNNVTLIVSYIGYATKEIPSNGQTSISVTLEESAAGLDEVVVVGYGTQKKASLTGAISTISTEELTTVTTSDLRTAMVGKLPGLRVMQRGGEPGSYDSAMDIRGWGAPLVIVDGVPRGDFQKIDPNTIASITILKDASAAVYGVKAANGVILIESKAGHKGKTEINFTSTYSIQKMTEFPEPIDNSIDNLILKNEAALAAGNPLPYPDYLEYDGSNPLKPNINYWDLTMKETSPQIQNVISASGGSEKINYYLSYSNMYDEGLFKTDNLKYNRNNLKSNITAQISDNIKAQMIITGLVDNKRSPYGGTSYDFFKQVWMQPAYEPVYYWDSDLGAYDQTKYFDGQADRNPLAVIDPDVSGYREQVNKQAEITTSLTYDVPFLEGLSLKGLYAYDTRVQTEKQWRKGYKEYKPSGDFVQPQGSTRLRHILNEWTYSHLQFSGNYLKSFDDHNFTGLLLYEQRKGSGNWFQAGRYYAIDILDQLDAGNADDQQANGQEKVPGDGLDAANRAVVGRVNYDYNSKYLAEFSFRVDGSSNFAKKERWGYFPAFSVGWRLSEESFIKDYIPSIDNLKLRASHGILGDDSAAVDFQYIEGFSYPDGGYLFSGDSWTTGSEYRGLANPGLTWYTSTTMNLGLDVSLWKNLLGAQFDVFQRKRKDLLANRAIQIPGTFGTTLPLENLESDLSRGFELELSHFNTIGDVKYQAKGTFSITRSKWLHREATPAGNAYANWRNHSDDRWKNIRWGYGYEGQFQTESEIRDYGVVQLNNGHDQMYPGDIKYEDWNEDGMIDSKDEHVIGRGNNPEMFYSFYLGAEWKGFALNAFFQGASGYSIQNTEQLQGPLPWGRNSSKMFLDRWHHENPLDFESPWVMGKYPISRDGFGYGPNKRTSPYWLHNANYLRLKSVEISYTLPEKWTNRINLNEVRLFSNALNLYTWSSVKDISDPERPLDGDGADYGYKYPLMANYSFGINVKF